MGESLLLLLGLRVMQKAFQLHFFILFFLSVFFGWTNKSFFLLTQVYVTSTERDMLCNVMPCALEINSKHVKCALQPLQ